MESSIINEEINDLLRIMMMKRNKKDIQTFCINH